VKFVSVRVIAISASLPKAAFFRAPVTEINYSGSAKGLLLYVRFYIQCQAYSSNVSKHISKGAGLVSRGEEDNIGVRAKDTGCPFPWLGFRHTGPSQ
jgi:hypothetical protein